VVRIALVQLRSLKTRAESIEHVIKMLRKAGAVEADIVSLPELLYPKIVHSFEQEFKRIIDISKEQNMIIISGAFLDIIKMIYSSRPRDFKRRNDIRKTVQDTSLWEAKEGCKIGYQDGDF
jgi:predicted amidohydrolase